MRKRHSPASPHPSLLHPADGRWLPTSPGWGTLYVVDTAPTTADSTQVPAVPVAWSISTGTGTRSGQWQPVPPSPWSPVDDSVPPEPANLSRMLGVGPDGLLLLEVHSAAVQLEPGNAAQEQAAVGVIGVWDPNAGQWLSPTLVEPATSSILSVVWDDQGTNTAGQLTIWFVTPSGVLWSVAVFTSDWQIFQEKLRCPRCR